MKMTLTPSALSSAMTSQQPLGLGERQARGRLVHDDEARVERQRLGDLDHLALGERQLGDRRVGLEIDAEAVEQRPHLGIERACGRPAAAARHRPARGR